MSLPLILGGSALLGGLGNLFGGEEEEITMEDLMKYGWNPYDSKIEKTKLLKLAESLKKQRRSQANRKASQLGLDPVASSYGAEEDIDTSLISGLSDVDKTAADEKSRIGMMLAQMNLGNRDNESGLSKFIGGAIQGAGQGVNVMSILEKLGGGIKDTTADPGGNTVNKPMPTLPNLNTETSMNATNTDVLPVIDGIFRNQNGKGMTLSDLNMMDLDSEGEMSLKSGYKGLDKISSLPPYNDVLRRLGLNYKRFL